MYGAPPLAVEEVEADDAIGVDVRVPWDGVVIVLDEHDLGRLKPHELAPIDMNGNWRGERRKSNLLRSGTFG